MFEGLLANLLNRFLGLYIRNFDAKQLNIGIWSGDVQLRDLQLRREALDQLRLPLNVIGGHIGQLTLQISWANLRNRPVQIRIQDVFLLVTTRIDAPYDADDEEARAHAVKMKRLDNAELLKERSLNDSVSSVEQQQSQSFAASLATAIVDNIQVSVSNIHVRYEDAISCPGHPFALGITLDNFNIASTDDNWFPTFIQSASNIMHKLISLESLSIYWDTDASLLSSGGSSDEDDKLTSSPTSTNTVSGDKTSSDVDSSLLETLRNLSLDREKQSGAEHTYLLTPITGHAGFEICKVRQAGRARLKTELIFDEIGFVLKDTQYRDALMLIDSLHYFNRHQKFRKFAPPKRPLEDPAAWMRFVIRVVLDRVHEKHRRWSWDYFRERRDARRRYVDICMKRKRGLVLNAEEEADADAIERRYSYEDLSFWRSLARYTLKKENNCTVKLAPKPTWFQWIRGAGISSSTVSNNTPEEVPSQMTEEQRKKLYEVIEWDEKQSLTDSIETPREHVQIEANMQLKTGSLKLQRECGSDQIGSDIVQLLFDVFKAQLLVHPDSLLFNCSLDGLRLYDGTTPGSLFPQIISFKPLPVPDSKQGTDMRNTPVVEPETELSTEGLDFPAVFHDAQDEMTNISEVGSVKPLFELTVEKNPLDNDADTALTMKLRGMEIVYNRQFVEEVYRFFEPPERHMESIGALIETAEATVEGLRMFTRAGLEFALEEHKTVDARLDVQAPLIIIPDSVLEKSSQCLIIDAGHVNLRSKLADKQTLQEVQNKQKKVYTEGDYQRLEELMYDKFLIKVESIQVLLGTSVEDTRRALCGNDRVEWRIIDRIDMDFTFDVCIIQKVSDLTKCRVAGHLPMLHVCMSDRKLKDLIQLAESAAPVFARNEISANIKDDEEGSGQSDGEPRRDDSIIGQGGFWGGDEISLISAEEEGDGRESSPSKSSIDGMDNRINGHSKGRLSQGILDVTFTADKLQGSVFRENEHEQKLMAELVAERFVLKTVVREFDTGTEVRLGSFTIRDCLEPVRTSGDLGNIVWSETKGHIDEPSGDLLQINLVWVSSSSPELGGRYEGVNIHLDVTVSTIYVVFTSQTVLTLYDFILKTFTEVNTRDLDMGRKLIPRSKINEVGDERVRKNGEWKIRVKAVLKEIGIILNDDGQRLATLRLSSADVNFFWCSYGMELRSRLGNLSLVNDMNGVEGTAEGDGRFRQLICIQGEELADIRYEANSGQDGNWDSKVYLRAGSVKCHFVSEAIQRIVEFLVRFGRMQALLNAARMAAVHGASHMQEGASRLLFDLVIRTPIVVFPDVKEGQNGMVKSCLTLYVGEIFARNRLEHHNEAEPTSMVNRVEAGVRNTRAVWHGRVWKEVETMEMLKKVDVNFDIKYEIRGEGIIDVKGSVSNANLRIAPVQARFIMELLVNVPGALLLGGKNGEPKEEDKEEKKDEIGRVTMRVGSVMGQAGIELLERNESLAKFSLNKIEIVYEMHEDGKHSVDYWIGWYMIEDTRPQGINKFRRVMRVEDEGDSRQFKGKVEYDDGGIVCDVEVTNPRVIFAMDHLYGLWRYYYDVMWGVGKEDGSKVVRIEGGGWDVWVRVKIDKGEMAVLDNPAMENTEAIVLRSEFMEVEWKGSKGRLQMEKVGMFLCRIEEFDKTGQRILDDFGIQGEIDMIEGEERSLFNVRWKLDTLTMRVSLRDILLAMQIANRASEIVGNSGVYGEGESAMDGKEGRMVEGNGTGMGEGEEGEEEMRVEIDGLRAAVMGDSHELAMMDVCTKKFCVQVMNWRGGGIRVETGIDMWINVFSFSKSAWEPLMEAWHVEVKGWKREEQNGEIVMDIYSDKVMEVTITNEMVELGIKTMMWWQRMDKGLLTKPRGSGKPFKLQNWTGYDMKVWSSNSGEKDRKAIGIKDGEEMEWEFGEGRRWGGERIRNSEGTGVLGTELKESGFRKVERICLGGEGKKLYRLEGLDCGKVQHYMLVENILGEDNVKRVTFESPLRVENKTGHEIEIGVLNEQEGLLVRIVRIKSNEERSLPVGQATYSGKMVIRWYKGKGKFGWSTAYFSWRDLVKVEQRVECEECGEGVLGEGNARFFYQLCGVKEGGCIEYPYMRIQVWAPLKMENMLPYDIEVTVYDKQSQWREKREIIGYGGVVWMHSVDVKHLIMIQVNIKSIRYRQSQFAVINEGENGRLDDNMEVDSLIKVLDIEGGKLGINLQYDELARESGGLHIRLFASFIIINKTGYTLEIRNKSNSAVTVVGKDEQTVMIGEGEENANERWLVRIEGSKWSSSENWMAFGGCWETRVESEQGLEEMRFSVSIGEMEDSRIKYSRAVLIEPRLSVRNNLESVLWIRQTGSTRIWKVNSREESGVQWIRQCEKLELSISLGGGNWTRGFEMENVGLLYVKVEEDCPEEVEAQSGTKPPSASSTRPHPRLLRVESRIELRRIVLDITDSSHTWPYAIHNTSSHTVVFYQKPDTATHAKLLRYRLPQHSAMPFSWDYPAEKLRVLVVTCGGMRCDVMLDEIGSTCVLGPAAGAPPADGSAHRHIIRGEVLVRDSAIVLLLSDIKLPPPSSSLSCLPSTPTPPKLFSLNLSIKGIAASLVDNAILQEILYFSLSDISLSYNIFPRHETYLLSIDQFQLDNQLFSPIFPIVLYPTSSSSSPSSSSNNPSTTNRPLLELSLARIKSKIQAQFIHVKQLSLRFQPISIELDEDFIFSLFQFTRGPLQFWLDYQAKLARPLASDSLLNQIFFFEYLKIYTVQVHFSFVRTDRINSIHHHHPLASPSNPFFLLLLNILTMSIGNVNNARIRYNPLILQNIRISLSSLYANVKSHYFAETFRQVYLLLGSADFLGNPVGLFQTVGSGLFDILYQPYHNSIVNHRPRELGVDIAKGASSFVKKSVYGLSDSMAKITNSFSKGLAVATLDKDFQNQRTINRVHNRPKHALTALASGGNVLANSVLSGIEGLARHPIQGAQKDGVSGFMKGVGKGVLGLATKPAIGAFDLASTMAEGVRNTTTVFDHDDTALHRRRVPRFIDQDRIVRPYNPRSAYGQLSLKSLDNGKFASQAYLSHLDLSDLNTTIFITYEAIISARTKRLTSQWVLPLSHIHTITKQVDGINIQLKGSAAGPFIPVHSNILKNWLYDQISVAVRAFNDRLDEQAPP